MLAKLAVLLVVGVSLVFMAPAHADVQSLSLGKSFYTNDEKIEFVGTEDDGQQQVSVVIKRNGDTVTLLGDPSSDADGSFTTISRTVDDIFQREGIYEAIAFTTSQKIEDGVLIELEYDGDRVARVAEFVLSLKSIPDYVTEVGKTITFTATVTDRSIDDVTYSLDDGPSGATIDSKSGKFVWTPSVSQGNVQDVHYSFDVIATHGTQEDTERIIITVKQPYVEPAKTSESGTTTSTTEPKNLQVPASFVDESKDPQSYVDRYESEPAYKEWFDENFAEYDSIYHAVGLEKPLLIPASFVDESKDPQSYVDRYESEPAYKEWFDENFAEYDSIYHAVGLETPKTLAPFVDPNLDPQYYVDRYESEPAYKEWFDETYPDITIYDAVGLEEEEPIESEFGECGKGTDLVDGMCIIVDNSSGGGCLIATATYGTEMAPQVQLLREIRDNQLMSTDSGSSFMTGFNQLYYLFSPTIADMERDNPMFKQAVKIGITPLLSSLSIMSYAESESEILGYGIGVMLMNLGMYVAAPAMLIYKARRFVRV